MSVYRKLDFLSESIRLQYANFIVNHDSERVSDEELIDRLKNDEPIEYILNIADFCNREFYVDNRVLIPRPETQGIVQKTFEQLQTRKISTIIDIGTGSGCILLSIAQELKEIELDTIKTIGIDRSEDAIAVAKLNANRLNNTQTEFIEADFRDFDFDRYENVMIVANLPYIPDQEKLQPSVAKFEPHSALFGGPNGSELNDILIEKFMKSPSSLVLIYEGYNGVISTIEK